MSKFVKMGQKIFGYQITQKIWHGNFSTTWQVRNSKGENFILQVIEDNRLYQEIIDNPLQIPNISSPYLAQLLSIIPQPLSLLWQPLSGRLLSTYIKQLKVIKPNIALYLTRKILEIVQFLDSQGLAHGALRPSHIIITPDKKVMATNFPLGIWEQRVLSKMFQDGDNMEQFARILPYFPNEVLEKGEYGSTQSEIYTLGIVLAEMLTGECVPPNRLIRTLNKNQVSSPIASIILKATTSKEDRYPDTDTMYEDLNQVLKASDEVEKIYVPTPGSMNVALEAIPADSREYRIYQASLLSAQQTVDAEVIAEPVELAEEELARAHEQNADPVMKKTAKTDKNVQKVTSRIRPNSFLLFSTIDKKILDPLEKDSIWPTVLLKYFFGILGISIVCGFLAYFLPNFQDTFPWWVLPFYTMKQWPEIWEFIGNIIAWTMVFFLFFLPILDPQGSLRHSKFFFYFFAVFCLGFIFLGCLALL